MDDRSDCLTVITGMTSGAESSRKLAVYHLQTLVADSSFADAFAQADGLPVLTKIVLEENGNALAYALGSLTRLLEMQVGWESINQAIIDRAVQLVVSRPSINVLRNTLYLLVLIASRPIDHAATSPSTALSTGWSFGIRAVMPVLQDHDLFLDCLVDKLGSADHVLCANALKLINALMRDSIVNGVDDQWPKLIIRLQELGVISAVEGLMRRGVLSDMTTPLLEFQGLTKVLLARWRTVHLEREKPEHREALNRLYISSFRPDHRASLSGHSDTSQTNADRAPDQWRRLGFQSEKPMREFQDAGFLGLMDLTEYVRRNLDKFQDVLLEQSVIPFDQRCPLARASLSVTMLLYEYFDVESIADEDIDSSVPSSVDQNNVGSHIEPLLLRWERLHCAFLDAFMKLWKEAGAMTRDYNKIEDLTRLLIGNILRKSTRKSTVEDVEREALGASLAQVRAWQIVELEEAYEYAWGVDYRRLRQRVHDEALRFLKEQRIRCLLRGSWFPVFSTMAGQTQAAGDNTQLTITAWRFVRLSHDRSYLHHASYPQKSEGDVAIRAMPQRIDLNTVSSVDSSVSRTPFSIPHEGSANGHTSNSGTITSLIIYGSSNPLSDPAGEEKVLLELSTNTSSLASEWLDGLLMLLNQQPITADTNKLVEMLESWTLKVRMSNLRWEDVDWQQAEAGEPKALPMRPTDRDYWYEMGD